MTRLIRLSVATQQRSQMLDVTESIERELRRIGVRDGVAIVYVPHTTAGVCINENADPDVQRDVLAKLEALIPKDEPYYRHGEGNSDSHVKTILTGNSVTVFIDDGRLVLGQWQGVYLMEFDGPRTRELIVKCLNEPRGGDM